MDLSGSQPEEMKSIRFNSDKNFFICFNNSGIRIYNISLISLTPIISLCYDPDETIKLCAYEGPTYICELAHASSNRFVVVTRSNLSSSEWDILQTVVVYDETTQQRMFYKTFVGKEVASVRCTNNTVFVVQKNALVIFQYPTSYGTIPYQSETRVNPNGLCELSLGDNNLVISFGPIDSTNLEGSLQISKFKPEENTSPMLSETETLQAHNSELAFIALNKSGTLLATASIKGTLIRVWDTKTRDKLHEFRRGWGTAIINCITFDYNSTLVCCISNKDTGQVFSLLKPELNKRSVFAGSSTVLGGYVDSQWAFGKFPVPSTTNSTCDFVSDEHILVLCKDGSYHKLQVNLETGECTIVERNEKFDGDQRASKLEFELVMTSTNSEE